MAIKHGTTTINAVDRFVYRMTATGMAHVYHNNSWVFDERCVRFYSSSSFKVKLANSGGTASWDGSIESTVSGSVASLSGWHPYTAGTELTADLVSYGNGLSRYEISFRGIGNTRLSTAANLNGSSTFTITGTDVYCEGDLLYLLDYTATSSYSAANYTYAYLFYNCAALKSAPKMTLAILPSYCYYYTYGSCTNLETSTSISIFEAYPMLSHTGFASGSTYNCSYMFSGCTKITAATLPSLISFTNYCYYYMFYGCSQLQSSPVLLPANRNVNFGSYCFAYMFCNCTSLTSAIFTSRLFGEQPGIGTSSVLGTYAFRSMFQGCTSLTYGRADSFITIYNIVRLTPTTLNGNCYRRMYYGCSSLKFAASGSGSYSHPYRIPASGTATGTTTNATYQMFTSTGGTYTSDPVLGTTYYGYVDGTTYVIAPVCDYDYDDTPDIKVTNNNSFSVDVYIWNIDDGEYEKMGTLTAGSSSWYEVGYFDESYDVYFMYGTNKSAITSAYSGEYRT